MPFETKLFSAFRAADVVRVSNLECLADTAASYNSYSTVRLLHRRGVFWEFLDQDIVLDSGKTTAGDIYGTVHELELYTLQPLAEGDIHREFI